MAQEAKTGKTTLQSYKLIARSITPVVLIAGLLILAIYHYRFVLNTAQTQDDVLRGTTSISQGRLEVDFQRDTGVDRPRMVYNALALVSYADWDSTIAVDGHVKPLWDNAHGYSFDAGHQQIFATTSGDGWQVTQVVQLVNDHSMTVTYQFTAQPIGTASPQRVALDIAHIHTSDKNARWFYPTVKGTTFSAEELSLTIQNPQTPYDPQAPQSFSPLGQTSLQVSGPAVASQAVTVDDESSAIVGGRQESWASLLTTHYVVTNPPVDQFIPLGTETITFQPLAGNAGTPIALPLP